MWSRPPTRGAWRWSSARDTVDPRREWSFGRVARFAATVAHHFDDARAAPRRRVLTLVGNRPEWVLTMVACFRQGYVVLPCTEQLRPKDLRQRLEVAVPALVVCDERNEETLRGRRLDGDDRALPVGRVARAHAPAARRTRPRGPVPDHLHERDGRRAEGRRARAALPRRPAAPGRALARRPPRRARVVHRRQRLEQVGAQRLHRAMAARRGRAAARRALRPRRAPGDPRRGARRGAVHGADRVPHHRQARRAAADADAARPRRRRRGAQPRGPARLARRHGPVGPRRLRPDRDRADHRDADRPARPSRARWAARCRASTPGSRTASSCSTRRRCRPSSAATSATRRRAAHGAPATASRRTTTASSSSRAAPTT